MQVMVLMVLQINYKEKDRHIRLRRRQNYVEIKGRMWEAHYEPWRIGGFLHISSIKSNPNYNLNFVVPSYHFIISYPTLLLFSLPSSFWMSILSSLLRMVIPESTFFISKYFWGCHIEKEEERNSKLNWKIK